VTADSNEPNDMRSTETTVSDQPERKLYPAGDEDWYLLAPASQFAPPPSLLRITRVKTLTDTAFSAPIHIDVYQDGNLVARVDGEVFYWGGSGHTFEVHVSNTAPALYRMSIS